jgi:hypothetical protein
MAQTTTVEPSGSSQQVSERVVDEVADATDTDRLDLEPLYEVVDADALDALFDQGQFGGAGAPTRVSFSYAGCDVVVSTGGQVSVSVIE